MAASPELAGRAAAVCRRPLPAKALREELVVLVRRAVPFGGYNFRSLIRCPLWAPRRWPMCLAFPGRGCPR